MSGWTLASINKKKAVWIVCVVVIFYFHLLVGVLVAIATAFYWLLEKQHHQRLLASDINMANAARIFRRISELAEEQHQRRNVWASYIAGYAENAPDVKKGQEYYLATVPILEGRDNKKHCPTATKFYGTPAENWLEWFADHFRRDMEQIAAEDTDATTRQLLIDRIAFETLLTEYALTTHEITDAAAHLAKVVREENRPPQS